MARSKRTRGAPRPDAAPGTCCPAGANCKGHCGRSNTKPSVTNVDLTQSAIDKHWEALPPAAKSFILDSTPDGLFSLSQLVAFWSRPDHVYCTRGGIAASSCGAAWYLALVHIKQRRWKEARALTLNGAFLHQCYNSSIEEVRDALSGLHLTQEGVRKKLPYYVRGHQSIRSPECMERFIRSYLPQEYTQMMTSFANLSTSSSMRGYIDQINDDWKGTVTHHKSKPAKDEGEGKPLQLFFVDDMDETERCSFDLGASTTLKSVFNDYADQRAISLRSLRFAYDGSTLFLSSAGNKTPEQLGMRDGDVIVVHDTTPPPESSSDESSCSKAASSPKSSSKKKKAKKVKGKKAKGKKPKQQPTHEPTMTLEEYRIQHSQRLTLLHEEAQPRFTTIRQRLNNLRIERSPKKKMMRAHPVKSVSAPATVDVPLLKEGLGGKAGRSHYVIQVGDVDNLYKSTKPSSGHASISSLPTLDLHGYTKEEALSKLDETLPLWIDAAMRGSYPFVQHADIVCGCGSQVVSEAVGEWIRTREGVRNAPRMKARRRAMGSRAA